jgi:hypothetical protein
MMKRVFTESKNGELYDSESGFMFMKIGHPSFDINWDIIEFNIETQDFSHEFNDYYYAIGKRDDPNKVDKFQLENLKPLSLKDLEYCKQHCIATLYMIIDYLSHYILNTAYSYFENLKHSFEIQYKYFSKAFNAHYFYPLALRDISNHFNHLNKINYLQEVRTLYFEGEFDIQTIDGSHCNNVREIYFKNTTILDMLSIVNFKNLTYVYFFNNLNLTTITLENTPLLAKFNIHSCNLLSNVVFKDDIYTCMKEIGIRQTVITTFSITKFPSLTTLHLMENRLDNIEFCNHLCINIIDLTFNRLNSVDMKFDMPSLDKLYFTTNNIKSFIIHHFPKLTHLDIDSNNAQTVDLFDLPSLSELDMSFNCIDFIDLTEFDNLIYFNGTYNNLIHIALPKNITELLLKGNKLTKLPYLSKLKKLYIDKNNFTTFDNIPVSDTVELLEYKENPMDHKFKNMELDDIKSYCRNNFRKRRLNEYKL